MQIWGRAGSGLDHTLTSAPLPPRPKRCCGRKRWQLVHMSPWYRGRAGTRFQNFPPYFWDLLGRCLRGSGLVAALRSPFSGALCPATLWAALWTRARTEEAAAGSGSTALGRGVETGTTPLPRGAGRFFVSQKSRKGMC